MSLSDPSSALNKRCLLVTGASSGIGKAIALSLAAQGAAVCVTGRNEQRLQETAAAAGKQTTALALDLTKPESAQRLADHVAESYGLLHGLVHCAGNIALSPMQESTLQDLEQQMQANLMAPYALSQRLLGALMKGQGDVVFINSSIVRHPRPNAGQFSATQHALRGVADCLREEINGEGVRVLSVYVGRTATPRQESLHALEGRAYHADQLMQPESVAAAVTAALRLPRDAEITELHIRPMIKS